MGRKRANGRFLFFLGACVMALATFTPPDAKAKNPCTRYENSTYSSEYGSCAGTGSFCEECIYWFGSTFVVGYIYMASVESCSLDTAEPSSCLAPPPPGGELLAAVPVRFDSRGNSGSAPPVGIARFCPEGGGLFNALEPGDRERRSVSGSFHRRPGSLPGLTEAQ